MDRIVKLQGVLPAGCIAVITNVVDVFYLTGVMANPHERFFALVVPQQGEPALLLPALDAEKAKVQNEELALVPVGDDRMPSDVIAALGLCQSRILVQHSHLTLRLAETVRSGFDVQELGSVDEAMAALRSVKDEFELHELREAARRADMVVARACEELRLGMTEAELARRVTEIARDELDGSDSFQPIVLFGERSALPHGVPSERELKPGDAVLFDLGVCYGGYSGDITRTYIVGNATADFMKVYDIVWRAAAAGRDAVRAGVTGAEVDRAARQVIEDAGYGPYFVHRVGHGLGLEVHEGPFLTGVSQEPLTAGMVVTIEPGIYLPGRFGIRIEDDLVVREDGAEVLTNSQRELEVLLALV